MENRAHLPNEFVEQKSEELKAALEEQLGAKIHGVVISVLCEGVSPEGIFVYPVSMGKWRSGIEHPAIIGRWIASFAEYIYTRVLMTKGGTNGAPTNNAGN